MASSIKTMAQLQTLLPVLRKKQGLSQLQLASRLGMSQQGYARIEKNPGVTSVERLLWILNALDVELVLAERSDAALHHSGAEKEQETW
jgi:HTH-type transcriptional regulator/antitoxin HipB